MRKSLKQSLLITLTGASLACLGALPLAAATAPAVTQSAQPGAQTLEQRADALLARMTLAEKVGQLSQIGPNSLGAGYEPETLIRKGLVGSVLWTIDTDLINKYQKMAVEETRLGIPILFGFDVIHGYKTTFPVPLAMASSWDPELVRRASQVAAAESLASGINWTFTPMVDIARDARWGRMVEGAGEDPYLGRAMARAQVLGFQGPALGAPGGILCSVKHFAGYGAADGGRDYDSCYLSEVELQNVYLPPFQAAIDAGCGAVMSAYMTLNDVPASGNAHMLREVLRQQMGFKGFVISDSYSVLALTGHGYSSDEADAARKALTAGVNMDMGSETYIRNVEALVQSGKLDPRVVDEMVREVLLVKLRMGLFERPYGNTADKAKILGDPAHRALAREAACKSMVLLRNEGALLPLSNGFKRIAVIGPLADSREDIKGPWTAENDVAVSVLDGLRHALPGVQFDYAVGGDMQRAYPMPWEAREGKPAPAIMDAPTMQAEQAKAVEAAKASELVIMVLGERANMCGEAASSSTLALDGNQQALLEAVVATGKPVVLVLLNGRPLDITWASAHVPAILEAWFPGSEGGNAVADILTGKVNPGGKLTVTWPRSAGQCPLYYNHNATQAREDEPFFTSRYANTSSLPLYPFGHGLSYTSFSYSGLSLDRTQIAPDGSLNVSVDVTNTGKVAGDEVVQLYIHQRHGSIVRPVRELKGFERITLAPGQTRKVTFRLGPDELGYWSPLTGRRVVEATDFDVWVGGDCRADAHAALAVR